MSGRRLVRGGALVLAAALVVGSGCSRRTKPEASPTTSSTPAATTSSAEPSSTTTATATVDTASVQGPPEWVPIVAGVYQRIRQLDVSPDPERVTEVYSESYSDLSRERETQKHLADNGLHVEGPPPRLIRVEGPSDQSDGTLQFTVTVEYSPFRLVRADGSVHQEVNDVPGRVRELLRVSPSGPGGAYRVLVKETV